MSITKSELIERVAGKQTQLSAKDVELAIKTIIEEMSQTLATGGRIEIRGFGSFSLHYREPRVGRNPKTGDSVELEAKHVPHFKPGKELRDRVNQAMQMEQELNDEGGSILEAGSGQPPELRQAISAKMRGEEKKAESPVAATDEDAPLPDPGVVNYSMLSNDENVVRREQSSGY